jgi:hypothetical protein
MSDVETLSKALQIASGSNDLDYLNVLLQISSGEYFLEQEVCIDQNKPGLIADDEGLRLEMTTEDYSEDVAASDATKPSKRPWKKKEYGISGLNLRKAGYIPPPQTMDKKVGCVPWILHHSHVPISRANK